MSQPPARLHHECAARRLSTPRWHHQERYKTASGNLCRNLRLCRVSLNFYFEFVDIKNGITSVNSNFIENVIEISSVGDVLLSINSVDLTQLTYNEAVSALKAQTAQSQVVLRVIQTISEDSEEDPEAVDKDEMDPIDDPREDTLNWTPLWTRWLGLPRYKLWLSPLNLNSVPPLHLCSVQDFSSDSAFVISVKCTGAGTSSCKRPIMRAGASVSSEAMRRATASSLSSSKPSCLVHPLTLTDASSELTSI